MYLCAALADTVFEDGVKPAASKSILALQSATGSTYKYNPTLASKNGQ